ncbi:MAG: RNA-binding S4 domain-containing protein [Polymorphobacter sp.]|uniref:RNA-binding S4 domain-containing protein n=1 Tax=Polymorphobacter sp. TaxID=1909290 RepID=UPI003A860941
MVYGASLRLDKWLWFARLAKSRGCAKALCESRRLRIDGRVVERASALVRPGQVLSYPDHAGDVVVVRVETLAERRGPYAEACLMYTDLATEAAPSHAPLMAAAHNQPLTGAAMAF